MERESAGDSVGLAALLRQTPSLFAGGVIPKPSRKPCTALLTLYRGAEESTREPRGVVGSLECLPMPRHRLQKLLSHGLALGPSPRMTGAHGTHQPSMRQQVTATAGGEPKQSTRVR